MNYSTLETAVKQRLADALKAHRIEVVELPEIQAEFKPIGEIPKITVGYVSSDYEKLASTAYAQDETICLNVMVQGRALRKGKTGVYAIVEAVKLLLIGFTPPNCRPMWFDSSQFEEFENNTWTYMLRVKTMTTFTFQPEPDTVIMENLNTLLFDIDVA